MPVLIRYKYPEPLKTQAMFFLESMFDMDRKFEEGSELDIRASMAMCIICDMNYYQPPADNSPSQLIIIDDSNEPLIQLDHGSEPNDNDIPAASESVQQPD